MGFTSASARRPPVQNSNQPAVPEVFRDELQQSTAVQKALALLSKVPKAWTDDLAAYRAAAWAFQTAFSTHMIGDVALQRQQVDELSARVGRFVPGMATQDLEISLATARRTLATAEAVLNANPGEAERIARAAQRATNARRLQGLSEQMSRMHLERKVIEDTLLDERQALEETVARDQAERAREVAAMARASAEIEAARAVAIAAIVDALDEQIFGCAEDAAKILKPRLVVYLAYPQSIPGAAIACFRRA